MWRREFLTSSGLSLATIPAGTLGAAIAPSQAPIKIGQIGVGHAHAAGKMRIYRERTAEYEVVGIVEPDDKRWEAAARASTYSGLKRLTLDELFATEGLRAVAVETEVGDLLKNAEACIDAGLHVHLDKPAGVSFPNYKRMMAKADEAGLCVQMGYMYRFNPAIALLKQCLRNGWLGEVFEISAVMSKVVPSSARKGLAEFKGGIMFELGCHIIDLVVGVLGEPSKVTPHIRHHRDDGLADNVLAIFEYENATAAVRSTALEVEGFARRHLTVCGTGGTFHIQPLDRPTARIALSEERQSGDRIFKKGITEISFEPPYRRYVGDAIDLARVIRGDKKSDYPSSHDIAVQKSVLLASGMPLA